MRILLAFVVLLTLATPAHGEVLWEVVGESHDRLSLEPVGVFGTASECRNESERRAAAIYRKHLRGQYRDATMEATPAGWRVQAPVEFATLVGFFECHPDGVDLRGQERK